MTHHHDHEDHEEIRALVIAAVEQLYEGSFEARLRHAVEQMGDGTTLAFGRAMVRKAGADDGQVRECDRAFWLELGTFLCDVAEEQRRQFDALRIELDLEGDAEGAILDEDGDEIPLEGFDDL